MKVTDFGRDILACLQFEVDTCPLFETTPDIFLVKARPYYINMNKLCTNDVLIKGLFNKAHL